MNIYINGRFLTQTVTGVQRFAEEVIYALDELIEDKKIPNGNHFFILVPNDNYRKIRLKNIKIKQVGLLRGHAWEQIELPLYIREKILINFCNVGPLFKSNQIIVIHDASVFLHNNNYSRLFRWWYRLLIRMETRFSKKVVTVSDFSCNEIKKYTSISGEKIKVVYEGNEHFQRIPADENYIIKKKLNRDRYVLAVSSLNPNKNFKSVVDAVNLLKNEKIDVVIVGGKNNKIYGASQISGQKNVHYLGYVSDTQLKALYQHAFCFVYPSFYEGFGIPPVEAMTVGCPVIVSNTSSLPEICGNAALYCDPHNPADITDKIKLLMRDKVLKRRLIERGLERVSNFSWLKCAREIYNLID
ncbi:MAG: glycosyltransferase family 4 protein [Sporolactobacillus sp.]|jgi:glycosyltransferase involved in cell wall biosynthesis|nr:glycosyltransferase family 4 protein [Sporolactobacillus sp.]